jgi:hypothetical protein
MNDGFPPERGRLRPGEKNDGCGAGRAIPNTKLSDREGSASALRLGKPNGGVGAEHHRRAAVLRRHHLARLIYPHRGHPTAESVRMRHYFQSVTRWLQKISVIYPALALFQWVRRHALILGKLDRTVRNIWRRRLLSGLVHRVIHKRGGYHSSASLARHHDVPRTRPPGEWLGWQLSGRGAQPRSRSGKVPRRCRSVLEAGDTRDGARG